jgi:methionyl-tRNA formyltransferase
MGTPGFAVPALAALARLPGIVVAGVVTRKDQPAGRGRTLEAPPVKLAARDLGLPVIQPGSLRRPQAIEQLRALEPEVIIVAAFGQILPPDVLALPRFGCLNVHASLLPRYRGAAPISAAILAGDAETGVTLMLMDEGLDTGPIITSARLAIAPDDTTATLTERLATLSADLLTEALPHWLSGDLTPMPQDSTLATMTHPLRKEDGILDWSLPAQDLARRVRADHPWPGAYTTWRGQPLKIYRAHAIAASDLPADQRDAPAGTAIAWGRGAGAVVAIACGSGALALDVIQLPGKRALSAADVVRGQPDLVGARLPS